MGYAVFFESFADGAAGFMGVGAVAVATSVARLENLREIMGYFMNVEVDRAEALHSGSVDNM